MKTNSVKNRSKKGYRKYFIILPIVFLIVGYMLFFVCLTPIIDPLISVYSIAFSNANNQTIEESGTNSIFSGSTGIRSGTINYEDLKYPQYGDVFGNIKVEGTKIDCDLIFGSDTSLLRKGACVSLFGHIPGCGKGILVGAHNNTYFHSLPEVKKGALVNVETHYGSFVYRVIETKIIKDTQRSEYEKQLNGDNEVLLLYTCYPVDTLASTPDRFFVICEMVAGPVVNMYE